MTEINTVSSQLLETLKERLYTNANANKETTDEKLQRIRDQIKNLPSVLDPNTLQKLRNGEYEISLREYSDMNTYRTTMDALYGNKSADVFTNYIEEIFGTSNDQIASAKTFVEKMRENGMSNSSAVKLYTALKTYSLVSSFKNYSFVNAKI